MKTLLIIGLFMGMTTLGSQAQTTTGTQARPIDSVLNATPPTNQDSFTANHGSGNPRNRQNQHATGRDSTRQNRGQNRRMQRSNSAMPRSTTGSNR